MPHHQARRSAAANELSCSRQRSKDQTAIGATESKGIAEHEPRRNRLIAPQIGNGTVWIQLLAVHAAWHEPVLNGECTDHRLERTSRAERVPSGTLGRAAARAAAK